MSSQYNFDDADAVSERNSVSGRANKRVRGGRKGEPSSEEASGSLQQSPQAFEGGNKKPRLERTKRENPLRVRGEADSLSSSQGSDVQDVHSTGTSKSGGASSCILCLLGDALAEILSPEQLENLSDCAYHG